MLVVRAAAISDVGRARRLNEDSFAIEPEQGLYLVADGMGGHGHGEVASRLAARTVRESLGRGRRRRGRRSSMASRLKKAIAAANRQVLEEVERDVSLQGMGTTLVALVLEGERAVVAHVGDSRAYRFRDGRLEPLTSDHTWVREQVSAGRISETQARSHPFKSVVTRALGGEPGVEVETLELSVQPGDLLLLCSDGLTTMLTDDKIGECLGETAPPAEICRALVRAANAEGGRDNITVLLLAIEESDGGDQPP